MPQGLHIKASSTQQAHKNHLDFWAMLARYGLCQHVQMTTQAVGDSCFTRYTLEGSFAKVHLPGFDTLQIHQRCEPISAQFNHSVTPQILVALLASPIALRFPSYAELLSAIHMRKLIVRAASKTSMEFRTDLVDRPIEHWAYTEEAGFTLKPDKSLIEALLLATQPDRSGRLYGFSCYRATEYVILLAIAQEAKQHNPALLAKLEAQWRRQAIMSGQFHEVFLHEWGTNHSPLPTHWFVAGDRVWFRNPDNASSDVPGYEGSWVIYLGHGKFANFWHPQQPYDLETKCLEIYHWRHGTYRDTNGLLQMDEEKVAALVAQTKLDPTLAQQICQRMMRLRDPKGIYAEGGCMDTTRESPRWIHAQTSDIVLPVLK